MRKSSFLSYLLATLHEDIIAAQPGFEHPEVARSCIAEAFQFKIHSEVEFPDTDDRSEKVEPVMSMSLPLLKTSTTLESCLDLFTEKEELTPDNWLANPQTGWPERSSKTLKVLTAPECLILHLKRFARGLLRCTSIQDQRTG